MTKNIFVSFASLALSLLLTGSARSSEASGIAIPNPSAPRDTKASLKITVPTGASASVNDRGKVVVKAGPHFALEVGAIAVDLKDFAKDVTAPGGALKSPQVHVATGTLLVYSDRGTTFSDTPAGQTRFSFIAQIDLKDQAFECRGESTSSQVFTRADVDAMVRACLSIKK